MAGEKAQGGVADIEEDADASREFWSPDNLISMFQNEAKDFSRAHEEGRQFEKGFFLEKLWSAVDYALRETYEGEGGDEEVWQRYPESAREEMRLYYDDAKKKVRNLYGEIFEQHAADPAEKVRIAKELRAFGELLLSAGLFSPDAIDDLARKNEEYAIAELGRIKKGDVPFWVERKKGFTDSVDKNAFPPFSARPILEEYRKREELREKPTSKHEGFKHPEDAGGESDE